MAWIRPLLCLCIIAVVTGDEGPDSKVVNTTQGPVRGYRDPEGGLFAFHSIPYATAPSGTLKFKAPLPPPMWTETLEAVDKQIICPQIFGLTRFVTVQEDCLIANVYVPDTEETELPVIVYVHGGAFQAGFGNMMTPKHLVRSKNVIVVTFNYRLGPHGFLCLGTDDVPGNAALKDQVAALRWVNQNIMKFGGNSDDVTIAGYSAGATCVDLLAISKQAEGLFTKVIIESGSNLMSGGVVSDPLESARMFAAGLGFANLDDVYALENFYKSASYDTLMSGGLINRPNSTTYFAPCIERDTNEEAFLTETPFNILKENKYQRVPILYGFANMEGLYRERLFDIWKIEMNDKFSDFLPGDLHFESDQQKEEVAKEVKEFYFKDAPINEENILSYIDYFSDVIFNYQILRSVKMLVENGHDKVYLYEYSFVDEDDPVVPHTDVRGATHCAQTDAVFDGLNMINRSEENISEDRRKVKSIIRDFWTNFAITGSPVPAGSDLPAWPAADANRSPYMDITVPPRLLGELLPHRVRFWDGIYERYYRSPIPPPPPPAISNSMSNNLFQNQIIFLIISVQLTMLL